MTQTKSLFYAATIALMPSFANAGGFDLTGQPIDIIFKDGNYVEGQVGIVVGDVEVNNPAGNSGNVANDTPFLNAGVKFDITDQISAAVIFDTPYLRSTTYNAGLFRGTSADVDANTITAVGRFKFNENFSVYGGPRLQRASVDLQGPQALPGFPFYEIDVKDTGFGFVVGAAAEIPEYKIRAAVTYNSEIDHDFDSEENFTPAVLGPNPFRGSFDIHTPQSVNVELQAPVTETTLVRANIRWAEWGGVDFRPPGFFTGTQALTGTGRPVVEYTEDVFTYRLTVAQRINENFVGFVTGSYEADGGEAISLFKTVDGGISAGGGMIYENEDGLTLTLAGEYRWLEGTAGVQATGAPASRVEDASAFGASFKVGYSF